MLPVPIKLNSKYCVVTQKNVRLIRYSYQSFQSQKIDPHLDFLSGDFFDFRINIKLLNAGRSGSLKSENNLILEMLKDLDNPSLHCSDGLSIYVYFSS